MSTDIGIHTIRNWQSEKRSWQIVEPGGIGFGYTPSGTLDVSSFTPATHFPNGYFLSGTVLGLITATGLYGPYDDDASDGREVAAGYLFHSIPLPDPGDLTQDAPCALVVAFTVVKVSKLPIASGATGGGFIDAAGQADLPLILHIP